MAPGKAESPAATVFLQAVADPFAAIRMGGVVLQAGRAMKQRLAWLVCLVPLGLTASDQTNRVIQVKTSQEGNFSEPTLDLRRGRPDFRWRLIRIRGR